MDRLLKRIQRFVQLLSAIEIFSSCTIMRPPTKLQVFANFWPQKMLQPLSPPVLSRFISTRLFSVPQIENEVKRTPLCGCCWDPRSRNWWIKECPKRGIFGSFSETVRPHIWSVCMSMELILNLKSMCLPNVSSIFQKKSVLKLLDRTVYKYIGLQVKYSFVLSDFNKTWIFSANFRNIPIYQISRKSDDQWQPARGQTRRS